ncbi:uncharacterized protein EV422DRAFT_60306 [Fimicolochytrium jonesii]|uniref:uncharacterized protein n=1 Tax=Fimicolochytrium jonesii TaxID=1396493 RepID=UPI0022FE99D9|nr:uncharacterized protein EV422DRAFT_60306 [Fimicolochytrium jonesii]KAI8820705.1 hypothetical protein EV422DRAFT_60306 [Fimicolochytrium jonesii]
MERPPLRVEKARVAADVTMEKTPAELAADEVPPSTPKAVAKSFVSESSFTFSSSSSAQTPEPMKAKVVLDWEVEIEPVAKSGRVLVSAKKPVQSAEPVTPAKLVSAMRTVSAKKIVQLPDDAAPRDSAVAIRKNTKEGRIKPISLKSDSSSSGSDICEHDETLVAPNSDKAVSAKKGGLQWALEQYRAKKKLSDQSHGTSAIKTPSKPMVMTDLFDRRERSTGRRDPDETMLISASPFITPGAKERKSLLERVRTERQTVDETFTEKGKSSAKRGRKGLSQGSRCSRLTTAIHFLPSPRGRR